MYGERYGDLIDKDKLLLTAYFIDKITDKNLVK